MSEREKAEQIYQIAKMSPDQERPLVIASCGKG